MQPVMFCILTVLETVLREERIAVHAELYIPVALSEDRWVLREPCTEGCVPNTHTGTSTTAQSHPAPVLPRAGGASQGW